MTDQNNNQSDPGMSEQPTAPATPPEATAPPAELSASEVHSKKILVGILAIVLGAFGVHKFILGYRTPAFIMLGVSIAGLVSGCIMIFPIVVVWAMAIVGLVEGIIYLTKSDAEFKAMYLDGTKEWF